VYDYIWPVLPCLSLHAILTGAHALPFHVFPLMVIVRKFSRFFFGFLRDILVVNVLMLVEEKALTELKTKFTTAMTTTTTTTTTTIIIIIIIFIITKIQLFIINVSTQNDVTRTQNN